MSNQKIFEKSLVVFPGGVNSPVRSFQEVGISPIIVQKGKKDEIVDADGKKYIDYCMGWGSLILGHANPEITKQTLQRIKLGTSFGIATEDELKLGEEIKKLQPAIEKLRFVSTGTEATMTALRLARAFTGKKIIVKFNGNYHGHHDSLLVKAGSGVSFLPVATSQGLLPEMIQYTLSIPYNDEEKIAELFDKSPYKDDIAAVIIEPVAANMGVVPAKKSFLNLLRKKTKERESLLIFDEVISGFRLGLQGATGLYQISPDLICLGKIIGHGYPAAAFGGRKEIMDLLAPLGPVYQAGTLSGHPVAMVAGFTALQEIQKNQNFYQDLERKTKIIAAPVQEALKKKKLGCFVQAGSLCTLFFGVENPTCKEDLNALNLSLFKKLFAHLLKHGIYIPPSNYEAWFISSAHTDKHLAYTRDKILEFLEKI